MKVSILSYLIWSSLILGSCSLSTPIQEPAPVKVPAPTTVSQSASVPSEAVIVTTGSTATLGDATPGSASWKNIPNR